MCSDVTHMLFVPRGGSGALGYLRNVEGGRELFRVCSLLPAARPWAPPRLAGVALLPWEASPLWGHPESDILCYNGYFYPDNKVSLPKPGVRLLHWGGAPHSPCALPRVKQITTRHRWADAGTALRRTSILQLCQASLSHAANKISLLLTYVYIDGLLITAGAHFLSLERA